MNHNVEMLCMISRMSILISVKGESLSSISDYMMVDKSTVWRWVTGKSRPKSKQTIKRIKQWYAKQEKDNED